MVLFLKIPNLKFTIAKQNRRKLSTKIFISAFTIILQEQFIKGEIKMSTKNRNFSKGFYLTEHGGKFGLNNQNGVVLYSVYDSIWELDNLDFIIEQDGKLGYASYASQEQNEIELLLPLYDDIIKKEHGLCLTKRTEQGKKHCWYDTKSYTLHSSILHIRSFRNYDAFVSTKKGNYAKQPFLKKWGEETYIEIPFDSNADILNEIPCGKITFFVLVEESKDDKYKYSFLIIENDERYTFSATKENIEELYEILPILIKDLKCNTKILWISTK